MAAARQKTRAYFGMTTAEPLGDEHFYPLPQKLGARILKYPLGLSIHQDDLARSVKEPLINWRCGVW